MEKRRPEFLNNGVEALKGETEKEVRRRRRQGSFWEFL